MILQALHALYDRLAEDPEYKVVPPGYSLQKVTFKVVLTGAGDLLEIQDARRNVDGRMRPRQLPVPGGRPRSGNKPKPYFMWDNSRYLLGYRVEDDNPELTTRCFAALRDLHLSSEGDIGSAAFSAVCRFLERWDPADAEGDSVLQDAAKTGYGVFQLQGESSFVHEAPAIDRWWRSRESSEEPVLGQCLVTGSHDLLAITHDKVRGVRGAQGAGGALVSFNETAYESYGMTQSCNAPVSQDAAFKYVTALNALLDGPRREKHKLTLGDATVAFWTEKPTPTEDIFVAFSKEGSALLTDDSAQDEGQRQRVEAFLKALRNGADAYGLMEDDPAATPYYLLGLSPNSGRISVRFFFRATLADLLENLRRHHQDIELERRPPAGKWAGDPEYVPAWLLLRQTARDAKDVPPLMAAPLLKAIVTGAHYPSALYSAVIRRIRADRGIDYFRCCVLKGYLNRNLRQEVTVTLDRDRLDPAYRLGRLFAALEKTQKTHYRT